MKRDIIIIIEGGGMTVGFGVGVLDLINKKHLYSRVHSVYGSSAGTHDASYFLSKQTELGGEIPTEHLNKNKFIKKKKFFRFIKMILLGKKYNLMNIDYLIEVEKHIKKLDVRSIKNSPIKLFFRVFNIDKFQSEIIDGKDHIFEGLKASSSCIPYFNDLVRIKGDLCADGSKMITKSFEEIILKNKDKKIIYIINHYQRVIDVILNYPIQFLESLLIWRIYGFRLGVKYATTFDFIKVNRLRKYKNVILIINKLNNDIACTDSQKLEELFDYGKEGGCCV